MSGLQQRSGGASALPLVLIAQSVPKLSRHDLEALTERLIDRLDEMDGDFDLEDDPSGQCDEDEMNTGNTGFALHGTEDRGPECPISDPGGRRREPRLGRRFNQMTAPVVSFP